MRKYRNASKYISLLIPPLATMLVSGLWHGAGWTFIIWGGLHGLMIVIYQLLGLGGNWQPVGRLKRFLAWAIMFFLIIFSWSFFRATSLEWLTHVLLQSPKSISMDEMLTGIAGLSFITFYSAPLIGKYLLDRYFPKADWLQGAYLAILTVLTIVYSSSGSSDFIYSQF